MTRDSGAEDDSGMEIRSVQAQATPSLKLGPKTPAPEPVSEHGPTINLPQRVKQADDLRLYRERLGHRPGQGAVIGSA